MAEEKETKRRRRATGEPAPVANTQNLKAGEILRQARIAKGLELSEISSAIHVRVGQLKAIEENHLDQLPGMTYALGFVKSYATHLKLDSIEIANKFKAENGAATAKAPLQNHEPLGGSKMPDPFILGAAGVCVLVILLVVYIFSDGDEQAEQIASAIPTAPAIVDATPVIAAQPATVAGGDPSAPAPIPTAPLTGVVTPVQTAAEKPGDATATSAAPAAAGMTSAMPRPKPGAPAEAETADAAAAATTTAEGTEEINVRGSRGRVALKATQPSWVQITDSSRNIVFKKVLRPGEVYYVPEGATHSLITSNAGGLDVYVDGSRVKTLGGQGDIVRGVKLQPEMLKRNKPKKSDFRE